MTCGVIVEKNVPDNKVGGVVQCYQEDGALKVETAKQSDGQWTVTATYPPCEDDAAAGTG